MRGRKPIPTAFKLVTDNPGHRPLPEDEPKPPDDPIKCPPLLNKDSRKTWRWIVPILHEMGVATVIDVSTLTRYCDGNARLISLKQELATILNPNTKKRKLTARAEQYRVECHRWKAATIETAKGLVKFDDLQKKFVTHPYLKIEQVAYARMAAIEKDIDFELRSTREQMRRDEIEMGMTPSSRSRVKATPPAKEAENKKERFFSK